MTERPRRFRVTAAALLALLLCLGAAAAGAQSSDDQGTVVAAWDITAGVPRADADIPVLRSRQQTYDRVEGYVWQALPPDVRSRVERLELFVVPESASDPSDGTVIENDAGTAWILGLDEGEGERALLGGDAEDERTFDETIVHEVGHILSLSPDQMTGDERTGTYVVDEGTLRPDAWLNVFYNTFWRNRYPGWKDNEDPDQTTKLYLTHRDAFVTEYAATNPVEDFAETFTAFVLRPRPTGVRMRDRKVLFLWSIPALVQERDVLRKALESVN